METFAGMEAFARVVEAGSFTAAAERLQTAKSSVSETIRALEERLGVRLLDRTTRRVRRLVDEGLDLAIRVAEKPEPGLVVRRIASSHVVIVATPGYLAALGTPKHPDELPAHRCVGFTPLEWRQTWRLGKHKIAIRP